MQSDSANPVTPLSLRMVTQPLERLCYTDLHIDRKRLLINESRNQSGKFLQGTNGGLGRPRGKSAESRMKDAVPDALYVLIDAAKTGDVHAATAILDRVWPVESEI